jgi:hypothetical protein
MRGPCSSFTMCSFASGTRRRGLKRWDSGWSSRAEDGHLPNGRRRPIRHVSEKRSTGREVARDRDAKGVALNPGYSAPEALPGNSALRLPSRPHSNTPRIGDRYQGRCRPVGPSVAASPTPAHELRSWQCWFLGPPAQARTHNLRLRKVEASRTHAGSLPEYLLSRCAGDRFPGR